MAGLASIPSTSSPVAASGSASRPVPTPSSRTGPPRPARRGAPRWPRPGTRRRTSRRRRRRRPRRSCPTRSPAPAQSNTRRAGQRPRSRTGLVAWVHGCRRHRLPRPRGHDADAARGGRGDAAVPHRALRQPVGLARGRARGAQGRRRGARRGGRVPRAAGPARSCSPAAAPRPTTSPSSASCAAHGGVAVCTAVEHHAVLHPVEHLGGRIVGVDRTGRRRPRRAGRRARRRRSPSCR